MYFRAKQKSVTLLEARLREQFQEEQIFAISDSVRSNVLDYVSHFAPAITEDELVSRLERRLQQQIEQAPEPLISDSVRHAVMNSVRLSAARKREQAEQVETGFTQSFAEALHRLARFTAPAALCLALYVWSVGVIPEYPVGALYDAGSESAISGAAR
ncbi:MAG: hypothetical protein U0136_10600 [Bdellovibrionota bacterium]